VEVPKEEPGPGDRARQAVSAVLGNLVLVDYGRTIAGEDIPSPAGHRRYRPRLRETNITYRVAYDHDAARTQAAMLTVRQDPRKALPAVELGGDGSTWVSQRDLLASGRFATEFVVESESDGRAYLRFGDGIFGRAPRGSEALTARYRIGNGTPGNIGADALAHVVTAQGVSGVRNPLPAQGGTAPESLEEVRLYAPQAFRTQERAVTEEDYMAVAQRHPQVQKAMATRRWTGSWYTMFLTVDRKGGLSVDTDFERDLRLFLERFRLAGQDLEIDGPRFVSLEIVLTVCVEPGYFRDQVKEALLEVFSSRALPDGRRGFFHPDRFTFGQPVYLSRIVAAAMQVPGVRWIDTSDRPPNLFRRWGEAAHGELAKAQIGMDRLEIASLDNDPSRRENGKLDFVMEGGL
jgi:predicted phage baseplate assembly protein